MDNESEITKPKGHTRVQWAVAITVNMTLITYGLQCGWLSPMAKILQSPDSPLGRPLTDTEISFIAGAPSVAAMFGIVTLVYVVDSFGRRCAILIIAGVQLMCWIITICPANFASLLVARSFCGIGAGGCFHVVPMYIKEISQDNIRGTLGAMVTLCQYLGILIMYSLGGYLEYYTVLYIVVGIPAVTMLTLFKAPESPSFLVKKGKMEEAAATIAFLRGLDANDKEIQAEIESIKREDDYFRSIPNISFLKIFEEKTWRRGFLILSMICIMRALNGAFAIIHYASIILATSEINISPELQSLGIPIFLTIGALVTMSSVDKLGRKVLLAVTFIISALAFTGLASIIVFHDYGWATPGWLPIVALLLAVFCYGGGVSPVPFIVMSEMFNFQIRAKLMACLSILSWFLSFVQLTFFTAISNSSGAHTAFYIFGTLNVIGTILTIVFLPETANKTVEQIEIELTKETKIDKKCVNY